MLGIVKTEDTLIIEFSMAYIPKKRKMIKFKCKCKNFGEYGIAYSSLNKEFILFNGHSQTVLYTFKKEK